MINDLWDIWADDTWGDDTWGEATPPVVTTAATLLGMMQVLDNELDIGVGGADETRALSALDTAQDVLESILANHPDTLGEISTITTTASTEYTTWPTALLRLDTLWLMNMNVTPTRPQWQIKVIQDVGGQAATGSYIGHLGDSAQGFGAPTRAYTNREYFFWAPIPDAVYTLRAYGLSAKTAITTRSQTFEYPDKVAVPMAAYAARMMKIGIGDPSGDLAALATEIYEPVINMLRQPTRQRPNARQYSQVHRT